MVLCGDNQESISCASPDGCLHFHIQPDDTQSTPPETSLPGFFTFVHFHILHLRICTLEHLPDGCLHFHIQPATLNLPRQKLHKLISLDFANLYIFTFLDLHIYQMDVYIFTSSTTSIQKLQKLHSLDFAEGCTNAMRKSLLECRKYERGVTFRNCKHLTFFFFILKKVI